VGVAGEHPRVLVLALEPAPRHPGDLVLGEPVVDDVGQPGDRRHEGEDVVLHLLVAGPAPGDVAAVVAGDELQLAAGDPAVAVDVLDGGVEVLLLDTGDGRAEAPGGRRHIDGADPDRVGGDALVGGVVGLAAGGGGRDGAAGRNRAAVPAEGRSGRRVRLGAGRGVGGGRAGDRSVGRGRLAGGRVGVRCRAGGGRGRRLAAVGGRGGGVGRGAGRRVVGAGCGRAGGRRR